MAAVKPPPLGQTARCTELWKFAWTLPDQGKHLSLGILKFLVPLQSLLNSSLSTFSRNYDLTELGYHGASGGEHSDREVVLIRLNPSPVRCTNDGKWLWPNDSPIKASEISALFKVVEEVVKRHIAENQVLGFQLDGQNNGRFTFAESTKKFDVLFTLYGASYYGILEEQTIRRRAPEIGAAVIPEVSQRFHGIREMIRVLKLICLRHKETTPDFQLTPDAFETSMLAYVKDMSPNTWKDSSFYSIFRGCLDIVKSTAENPLAHSSDTARNDQADPNNNLPLRSFFALWSDVEEAQLLSSLRKLVRAGSSLDLSATEQTQANLSASTSHSSTSFPDERKEPATPSKSKVFNASFAVFTPQSEDRSAELVSLTESRNNRPQKLFDRSQSSPLQLSALDTLSDSEPVNCVAVIGQKGQGKSFLLSSVVSLAGDGEAAFPSLSQPTRSTTTGVDALVTSPVGLFTKHVEGKLLLLDVEGAGMNGDIEKVMIPAMMAAQVIVYNCLGSFPTNSIINDLSVYTKKAQELQHPRGEFKSKQKVDEEIQAPVRLFGRLVFLIRDATDNDVEDARKRFYGEVADEGVAESSKQTQAAGRAMISKYFAGIDFACLPSPNDNMNAAKLLLSLVTEAFTSSLRGFLDKHIHPHLSARLTSMPRAQLTGPLLKLMLERFSANADNMTVTSLFMMVHELEIQKFMDSFQQQLFNLQKSFKPPVTDDDIRTGFQNLSISASTKFRNICSDVPEHMTTATLKRIADECESRMSQFMISNEQILVELCVRIVKDVVTDALRAQFESPNPVLLSDLEKIVKHKLDQLLPPIATGTLRALCYDESNRTLNLYYKRPTLQDVLAAITQARLLVFKGKMQQAVNLLQSWHKWMLQVPSTSDYVEIAEAVRQLPLSYVRNLAGELLSLAWLREPSIETCIFRDRLGLLHTLAAYFGKRVPHHPDTEKLFQAAIDLARSKHNDQVPAALTGLGLFVKSHRKPETYQRALRIFDEALSLEGNIEAHTLIAYLSCLRYVKGAEIAHSTALELLPKHSTIESFGFAVQLICRKSIISADEAGDLLLSNIGTGSAQKDIAAFYWLTWWILVSKSPKPLPGTEPTEQLLKGRQILDDWIVRAQQSFHSMGYNGTSSFLSESFGIYWWKYAPQTDPVQAHKYLQIAVDTSEREDTSLRYYRLFISEYPHLETVDASIDEFGHAHSSNPAVMTLTERLAALVQQSTALEQEAVPVSLTATSSNSVDLNKNSLPNY